MAKIDTLDHGRVLDIGASFQTQLMRAAYPGSVIDTLGYTDPRFAGGESDTHIQYDLNYAPHPETWLPAAAPYDLIVMAEVIEHLYTAARPVLTCIASYLRPGGALVLQTPNATSLGRRTAAVRGRNPFSMIREDRSNPGHFCEFTMPELQNAVESSGLQVVETTATNYFGDQGLKKGLYDFLCSVLPGELRDGFTVTARKPE